MYGKSPSLATDLREIIINYPRKCTQKTVNIQNHSSTTYSSLSKVQFHPTGLGGVLCSIIEKSVMNIRKGNILKITETLKVLNDQHNTPRAAVHATREFYHEKSLQESY